MLIHIHTQYVENYGDTERPYWKYKGGNTYVVTGVTLPMNDTIGRVGESIVNSVRERIEYRNDYAEEYILDWEFAADDALTEDERLQQEYDGRIDYPSKRIEVM